MSPLPGRAALLAVIPLLALGCAAPPGPSGRSGAPGPSAPEPEPSTAAAALPSRPPVSEPAPIRAGMRAPPGRYGSEVDILHYDLELALSDTASWVAGRAGIRVAVVERTDSPLVLDLTGLAVDRVSVDGRAVDPEVGDGRLSVPLDAGPGDTVQVAVEYGGVPDDGLIVGRTVHGAPSVFADNWPNRARFWFPSRDHPSDKATVAFTVHAPASWKVVANGALVAAPEATPDGVGGPPATGSRRTWRWATTVPIPTYTMVVGAAEMVVDTLGAGPCGAEAPVARGEAGCVVTTTWLFPPDTARAAASFRRAPRMVEVFTEMLGPFPYEKLAHVQAATRFGGMENATAIFYSQEALAQGRDIEGTVAHEVAHQWFGDHVTETEWTHLWLSEGFATYLTAVWYERVDGEEAFRERMEANRASYLGSSTVGRPLVDPEVEDLFALLNANSYQKGGWVLHMLRREVGDEAFFQGLRLYLERFAPGTALTADLQAVLEEVSGRSLGDFFGRWVREPGHPVLETSWRWDPAGEAVELTVIQRQPEGWPVFPDPVEVELRDAAGSSLLRRSVELTGRTTRVRLPVAREPARLVVDPDVELLWEPASDASPDGGAG